MNSEVDESKLRKRMDDLHKDIDIMKDKKFRLTEINMEYIKKELLIPTFMEQHTNFSSFDKMIRSNNFKIDNEIEFRDITDTMEWNKYIENNSDFKNWNEMLRTAVLERATRKLI